jgi:hypothetical protein
VTKHDLFADLGRTIKSPDHRLGRPVPKLEPPHRLESTRGRGCVLPRLHDGR